MPCLPRRRQIWKYILYSSVFVSSRTRKASECWWKRTVVAHGSGDPVKENEGTFWVAQGCSMISIGVMVTQVDNGPELMHLCSMHFAVCKFCLNNRIILADIWGRVQQEASWKAVRIVQVQDGDGRCTKWIDLGPLLEGGSGLGSSVGKSIV